MLDDHLCYVITDRKTPWHLPHHKDFTLITQIVITHVAKSRCKLAIYLKVGWSKAPTYTKGLVEKQALDDLALDALDLADVISDQVRRLGPQSTTKKAITIFGHVGQQTQASLVTGGDASALKSLAARRLPIRQRSLFKLLYENVVSVAGSGVTSLMMWGWAFMVKLWKICSANRIILLLLMLSVVANAFYGSRATKEWWVEQNAGKYMAKLGVGGDNMVMQKGIYLEDLGRAVNASRTELLGVGEGGQCYHTFHHTIASPTASMPLMSPAASRGGIANRLARTRNRLAAYRHDLLVALRVVGRIERETVQTEWESWVWGEVGRCEGLEELMRGERLGEVVDIHGRRDLGNVREWYQGYCESCRGEMQRLGDVAGQVI